MKFIKLASLSMSLSLAVGVLAPVAVVAMSDGNQDRSGSMTRDEIRQMAEDRVKEIKDTAKTRLQELKSDVAERAQTVRTKVCEERKTNITGRVAAYQTFTTNHKQLFDDVLARIRDFQTAKNLTVDESLYTAATAAGDALTQESDTLAGLNINIDCSDTDSVATNLDAFRSEITTLHQSFVVYRQAIKAYAEAVKSAAKASQPTPTEVN